MRSHVRSVLLGLALSLCLAWQRPLLAQAPTEVRRVGDGVACSPELPRCNTPAPAEVVITGTRTKESVQRATVRTLIVTRKEADRRGARNVADALEGESGLQRQPGSNGVSGGLRVNGLDQERVLVLEDGEPIVGRSAGTVDLGEVPISGVERIEVVAGPMSSLYGSDAIGGVINIITGPPASEGFSLGTRSETRTRGQLFEEASANYKHGATWATLEASLASQSAVEQGRGPSLLLPSTRTHLFGIRAGAAVLPRVELTLKARWTHDHRESIFERVERLGGDPVVVLNAPTLDSDRLNLRALETLHLGTRSRIDFSLSRTWFSAETRTLRADRPADEIQKDRERVQHLEAIATLGEGPRTWVFGVTNRTEKLNTTAQVWEQGVPPRYLAREPLPPLRRTNVAGLAQLGWDFDDELRLMPGARVEVHNQHGVIASPKLSIAYRPSALVTARAGAGRGFRSPSPKELGFLLDHCWLGYSVSGDPELDPERSWGLTGDVSYRATDRVTLRASAYGNWVDDLIALVVKREGLCSPGWNYQTVNIARARTAGGEASIKLRALPWLSVDASYSYSWTRDDSTGDPLTGNPPHTLVGAITAEDLPRGLRAYLRYRHISESFVDDPEGDFYTPGYDALGARVGFRPAPPLELYVGGDNLFDVTQDRNNIGDLRPAVGRTFYVGLAGEFSAEDSEE